MSILVDAKTDPRPVTHQIKLIMAGDSGVGKTSYLTRMRGEGIATQATIGVDFAAFYVARPGHQGLVRVYVWDVAGNTRADSLTRSFLRDAQGAFLVFDLTQAATLASLRDNWVPRLLTENRAMLDEMDRHAALSKDGDVHAHLEMYVLGNKRDCEKQRFLTTEDAHAKVAAEYGVPYGEISCKMDMDMDVFVAPFLYLVDNIMRNSYMERAALVPSRPLQGSTNNTHGIPLGNAGGADDSGGGQCGGC